MTNCSPIMDSTQRLSDPSFVATCSKFAATFCLLVCLVILRIELWKFEPFSHTFKVFQDCHQLVLKQKNYESANPGLPPCADLMQWYYPLLSSRRLAYGATYENLVHIEMDFTRAEDAKQSDTECSSMIIF